MTHQLTVVTHTRGNRSEFLRQCCASVEASLPKGAQHLVIKLPAQDNLGLFLKARLAALSLGDIVAFVDDDDYLVDDSLSVAYEAIVTYNAGLSFTGERLIDVEGNTLCESDVRGPKFTSMLACHPGMAHHLCLIRTSCVSLDCWRRTRDYGFALEWVMKSSAALSSSGAVFVPRVGYCWRQHKASLSKSSEWSSVYRPELFSSVSKELRSMITIDKRIPNHAPGVTTTRNPGLSVTLLPTEGYS